MILFTVVMTGIRPEGEFCITTKSMSSARSTAIYTPPAESHLISPSEPGGVGVVTPGSVRMPKP
jgi:hypothetical protein